MGSGASNFWSTAHVALNQTDLDDMTTVNQLKLYTMIEKTKKQTKLNKKVIETH